MGPVTGTGIEIPQGWAAAADHVLSGNGRVLVLGPRDAGKSTFCRYVMDCAVAAGRSAALLDADTGQKTVGPPACVTLGRPVNGDLTLDALVFVGTTNPVRGWHGIVAGIGRLAAEAAADVLLVNTGGLLAGPGRRLKAAKIEALNPDLLIAIGRDPGLDRVFADHPGLPVLRLAPSRRARRKAEGERRATREQAFRDYFAGARAWSVAARDLVIEGAPAGALPERLLVGLADEAGRDLALGIVSRIEAGRLTVSTPVERNRVRLLRCGALLLDEAFREIRPAPSRASAASAATAQRRAAGEGRS